MTNRSLYLCLALAGFACRSTDARLGGSRRRGQTVRLDRVGRASRLLQPPLAVSQRRPCARALHLGWIRAETPMSRRLSPGFFSGRRGTWVRAPFVNLWIPRQHDLNVEGGRIGVQIRNGPCHFASTRPKRTCSEPKAQVQNDADDGRRDAGEGSGETRACA